MKIDDSRPIYRLTPSAWLVLIASVIAVVLAMRVGMSQMLSWLLDRPEYGHGLIIPFVAAFLIWQRRDSLERMPFTGSWAGFFLTVVALLVGAVGILSAIFTIEHYSVVLVLFGLVLALTGWKVFKQLWVPLLILLFMVPLPEFLYQNLSADLQLISSRIGVVVMRWLGIAVYLEGNVIDLGIYRLQVAEACSGLRYLFPLMTIGFLMACFFKDAFWKRLVLFVSSVPITILMNSFRVGLIGLMVDRWGVGMAEGFLHEFQGWVVFMLCVGIMALEIVVLARIGGGHRHWRDVFGLEFPPPTPAAPAPTRRQIPKPLLASGAAVFLVAALSFAYPERSDVIPARSSFEQFPETLGAWTAGTHQTLEQIYLDQLMLDDYELTNFSDGRDPAVNLYIAWYDTQRSGRSAHSPRTCLPTGGWRVNSFTKISIPNVVSGLDPLAVNRVLISMGNEQELVYYWFQQRGRVVTNEYAVKWYLFWDALTRHRTDGALVRFVVNLQPGQDLGAVDAELRSFAGALSKELTHYVPN